MVPVQLLKLRHSALPYTKADRARAEQAFYDRHANPMPGGVALGWLAIVFLLVLALWIVPGASAQETPKATQRANLPLSTIAHAQIAGSPLTVFIDGPSGFVFVLREARDRGHCISAENRPCVSSH